VGWSSTAAKEKWRTKGDSKTNAIDAWSEQSHCSDMRYPPLKKMTKKNHKSSGDPDTVTRNGRIVVVRNANLDCITTCTGATCVQMTTLRDNNDMSQKVSGHQHTKFQVFKIPWQSLCGEVENFLPATFCSQRVCQTTLGQP
jgi:hypothetical protein